MRLAVRRQSPLVDQYARPITHLQSAYDGNAGGRRVASLHAPNIGVNTALVGNLDGLRARVRAADRNSPLIRKCLRSLVANEIGTGITPRWKLPAFEEGSRDDARMQRLHLRLKTLFRCWARRADADGVTDYFGLNVLAARLRARTGEALVRRRRRRTVDGLPVPLQLQVIAPDHLPTWRNEDLGNGRQIIAGVQFGPIGNREGYWLHPRHPGEAYGQRVDNEPVFVSADQIAHIFDPIEPGQVRGEPPAAAAIFPAHIMDSATESYAELLRVSPLFALFLTSPNGDTGPFGDDAAEAAGANDAGELQVVYKPGSIGLVPPGFTVESTKPPQLPSELKEFMKGRARDITGAIGVNYEQGTGDYEGITYSSCRAATNEQHRECEQRQWTMWVPQFSQRTVEWFVDEVVRADLLLPDLGDVEYAADREAFVDIRWIPQGWQFIDPDSEIAALVKAKDNGIMSRDGIIAAQGWDAEEIDEERREGMLRERRLQLPSTVGMVAAAPPDVTPADRAARRAANG